MTAIAHRVVERKGDQQPLRKGAFRADIEGLRAIAVLFVLVWHAGVLQLPGGFVGVDVFFVISGFLMTGILYRELRSTHRVSLLEFYARRIKRLLPASSLVLLITAVASVIILPPARLYSALVDIVTAGFYVVNWRMAGSAVDYLAQDQAASPVQHFWSLAVEEQYYIVWPLLLAILVVIVGRRRRHLIGSWVGPILGLVFIGSLMWSVVLSNSNPGRAYFVTTTRLWELALGGLVAVYATRLPRLPGVVPTIGAWAGLLGIFATGFLLQPSVPFPGWVALIPTVGCALLILFGPHTGRFGPTRMLSARPMTWIGGMSYSLYLWHWPFIILGGFILTRSARELTVVEGLALTACSFLPAWLSLRFVENPIRNARWLGRKNARQNENTLFVGLAATSLCTITAMTLALVIGPTLQPAVYTPESQPISRSDPMDRESEPLGAQALGDSPESSEAGLPVDRVDRIFPNPASATNDLPVVYRNGCHADREEQAFRTCVFGPADGPRTVALIGDSHAAQWSAPLIKLSGEKGFTFIASSKSSCPLGDVAIRYSDGIDYFQCTAWSKNVESWLTGPDRPDVLIVSYSNYKQFAIGGEAAIADGVISALTRVKRAGVEILIIRDTPSFKSNIADCVDANRENLNRCAFSKAEAVDRRDSSQPRVAAAVGAELVDLTAAVCPAENCAPVIGNVLVWRDSNHLTATYARSLAPRLEPYLKI